MTFQNNRNKIIYLSLVIFFIFVSLLHYFSQRPLWTDENALLPSISTKNFYNAFTADFLVHYQICPRGFLILTKFLAQPFDYHVLGLRFVSLFSMLLGFLIWMKHYRRAFTEDWVFILAAMSFAVSFRMMYYAAEFKPYATELLVVAVFFLFLNYQKQYEDKPPDVKLYASVVLLPFLLLFSYAGFLVFWIVGYNFLGMIGKNRKIVVPLIIYSLVSLAVLALIYAVDMHGLFEKHPQDDYWMPYFLCRDSLGCFMETFFEGVQRFATWWFADKKIFKVMASPFIGLFLYALVRYGFGGLIKARFKIFDINALTAVLFSELFLLGILKKYPFMGERITLFFAPFVFYLVVKGICDLRRFKPALYLFGAYYVGFLIACGINSFLHCLGLYFPL